VQQDVHEGDDQHRREDVPYRLEVGDLHHLRHQRISRKMRVEGRVVGREPHAHDRAVGLLLELLGVLEEFPLGLVFLFKLFDLYGGALLARRQDQS